MTQNGTINIKLHEGQFRLEAASQDQTLTMDLSLEMMHGLSLALAGLLSRHHKQLTESDELLPVIDIVSPDVSFSANNMGVELTVTGHGLGPIRLTFPLTKALSLTEKMIDQARIVADKLNLPASE